MLRIAIGDLDRIDEARLVARQIVQRQPAAERAQILDQGPADLARVEFVRTLCRELAQCLAQAAQLQERRDTFLEGLRHAAAGQIGLAGFIEPRQPLGLDQDRHGAVPIQAQPAIGQRDGRLRQIGPGQSAIGLVRQCQPGDEARNGDGIRAHDVAVLDHAGPAEEAFAGRPAGQRIVAGIESGRRHHAVIQAADLLALGIPDGGEAAAAQSAHPRLHRAQRQAGRHRGIHRMAAGRQDAGARRRRVARLCRHHAARAHRRRLAVDDAGRDQSCLHDDAPPLFPAELRC